MSDIHLYSRALTTRYANAMSSPDRYHARPQDQTSPLNRELEQCKKRLHEAEDRIDELVEDNERLREALEEIVSAVEEEQKWPNPNYSSVAGYALGVSRRALDGKRLAIKGGGGDE